MTVLNTQTTATYYGNGTTTTFPFSFLIPSGKLIVTLTTGGYSSVVTSGYTVNGYDNPAGGSVVFYTAPASGTLITLERRLDLLQQLELTTGGAFYAEVVEDALDKSAMVDLQQQALLDRSIKGPSYEYPHNVTLPAADVRANKVLAFDSNGGVVVSSFSLSQIEAGATTEKSAQDAIDAATEADSARTDITAAKADFDPKYADFAGKYADFAPKYALFAPGYTDFAAKYADFDPKYTIAQSQWPTVQMAEKWADEDEDVEVMSGSGKFSAKHWAQKTANIIAGGTTVISGADGVPDFLGNKLLPGNGISLDVTQVGPSQTMTITNSAVPKFYTKASAALAQNASLVISTPNVKDGDGLKRVVSVFEETVGSSLSDTATDFDMADAAQFSLRDYAPSTAVTLVGNEKTGPNLMSLTTAGQDAAFYAVKLDDAGGRALAFYYSTSPVGVNVFIVTRYAAGTYTTGEKVMIAGVTNNFRCVRLSETKVALCYSTSTTPYVWNVRIIDVSGAGVITVGNAQILRNSGLDYGTSEMAFIPLSETEFFAASIDHSFGGVYNLNYSRVTVAGSTVTVGSWVIITSDSSSGIGFGAVGLLKSGVIALAWRNYTLARICVRLVDVTTNPYSLGGAALTLDVNSSNYVPCLVPLASDKFACIYVDTSDTLYARTFQYSGVETPSFVDTTTTLASGFRINYNNIPDAAVVSSPYNPILVGWSNVAPYRLRYLSLGLSATGGAVTLSEQSISTGTSTTAYQPFTNRQCWLTSDGYISTYIADYDQHGIVAFEYRPSLNATLASGSWSVADVGRAVVAANGVAKIASVNGATAELTTLDAFDHSGTFTAGQWALQDAALYGGLVYNLKGNLAVVRTVKDSSLWEAITATSASAPGGSLMAWSFDKGHSWAVWISSAKRVIATDKAALHGGVEGQWMVQNGTGSWIFPPEDSAQSALEAAFSIPENQTLPSVYASLGATSFAALGFVKSMSGTVELAFALPTAASSVNQFTLTYTSRSAWKRADSSYSIDYGREDQVTITKTSSGTASAFATVMTVEQA